MQSLRHTIVANLALKKVKLNINFIPIVCSAPLLYAYSHGFFAENGLDVSLSTAPSWSVVKDRLVYGYTDVAHLLTPMPLMIRQGIDGKQAIIRLTCIQNVNW